MNAAARLVHQSVLSRHLSLSFLLSRRQVAMLVLTLALITSALSIIYVAHTNRLLYASYQHHLIERNRLYVERGQLLLEHSTWMMQARIQQVAENQLGMHIPDHNTIKVVHE